MAAEYSRGPIAGRWARLRRLIAGCRAGSRTAACPRSRLPSPAAAAQPAPAARAQPPAAQPNPFVFNSDAAMLTFFIKADKAADFEKVMAKLHEALANSDKPERRQQAAGWKLYKASDPARTAR